MAAKVRKRRAARGGSADAALRPLSETALFVIFRSVSGKWRVALLEESPLLGTQAFEDELVHLVLGMLRA